MKIKLFILLTLSHELFAFMSPKDMMDRMTMENAKNMMLMPLHPEEKIAQGMRLMEEMGTVLEYTVTQVSKSSARSIQNEDDKILTHEFSLY